MNGPVGSGVPSNRLLVASLDIRIISQDSNSVESLF